MNLQIKNWFSVVAIFFSYLAIGQNDYFFNHYMFNQAYYNPAWVGTEGEAFLAGHHRTQWAGFSTSFDGSGGAPSTQLVSLVVPWEGKITGVGLAISNDNVAELNQLQARFSISYTKSLKFGSVSLGIMPTAFSQTLDFDKFRAIEPDPELPSGGKESQILPDLGAGLYFQSRGYFYAGISAINILEPSFDFGTPNLDNAIASNYLVLFGTESRLNREVIVKPSILIRTDLNSYSFELSAITEYKDVLWGGLSFRSSESITLLLGYAFMEEKQLKFGYAFDYVINEREAKQPTSHEVFIRYDLPGFVFGGRRAVKTPRFNF